MVYYFGQEWSFLKLHNISNILPFVVTSMVQSVDTMALARIGKCCRLLVREPTKGVFCGVLQPSWIECCVGGERNKTAQCVSCLIHM